MTIHIKAAPPGVVTTTTTTTPSSGRALLATPWRGAAVVAARSPAAAASARASAAARSLEAERQHRSEEEEQQGTTQTQSTLLLLSHAAPLAAGVMAARLAVLTARLLGRALMTSGRATKTTTPVRSRRRRVESAVPTLLPGPSPAGHENQPPSRGPSGASAPAIVWFRADLRTRDHAPLRAALASARVASVLPVFVFDAREYPSCRPCTAGGGGSSSSKDSSIKSTSSTSTNTSAVPTAGPRRAALVRGAVRELRARLRALGSDLLVRVGKPEHVLPRLAAATGAARVYCHREGGAGAHDAAVERAVSSALRSRAGGCELRCGGKGGGKGGSVQGWGAASALLHPADLPPALRGPASSPARSAARTAAKPASQSSGPPLTAFGDFCQRVAGVRVREPRAAPLRLKGLPSPLPAAASAAAAAGPSTLGAAAAAAASTTTLEPGPIPSMRELGFADDAATGSGGGETEALRQLRAFAQELRQRPQQRRRRAGAARSPSSSSSAATDAAAAASAFAARIAPWLAVGCLSPRDVFAELSAAKDSGGESSSSKSSKGAAVIATPPPARPLQQQQRRSGGAQADERAWLASELLLRDFFGMLGEWRNHGPAAPPPPAGAPAAAAAAASVAAPRLACA